MLLTRLWIEDSDMPGSNTTTFGPKSGNEAALPIANQLKLPVVLPGPTVSMRNWITWLPAESVIGLDTVCQFCQPPVSGTDNDAVAATPSTRRWKLPPGPWLATRTCAV